jgi:hypothetical protein
VQTLWQNPGRLKTEMKMRNALILLTILMVGSTASGVVYAQESPRMIVSPVARPGVPPIRSADPTGEYSAASVEGTVVAGFQTGNFNFGNWSITITPSACSDCLAGQYVFLLNYRGISYTRPTSQETGFGGGVLNADAGVINFSMYADNCASINPSSNLYTNPLPTFSFPGALYGGHDGEEPGRRLSIEAGAITGRISGRDCFNQTYLADVRLVRR